jgi:hypothetical protein
VKMVSVRAVILAPCYILITEFSSLERLNTVTRAQV